MENQVDNQNANNPDTSNEDELKRLEEIIKKSEEDIKALDDKLESLEREMNQKKAKLEDARKKSDEEKIPKILTRKQIKELNEKYERAKQEKLLETKNNIDAITKTEFEKARLIRVKKQDASESEQNSMEIQALQIETEALEKEISVKNTILYEVQEKLKETLADKVSEELKIGKLRSELGRSQSETQGWRIGNDEIRSKINSAVTQKNRLMHDYEKLANKADSINLKIQKSAKLLKDKLSELESLKNSL